MGALRLTCQGDPVGCIRMFFAAAYILLVSAWFVWTLETRSVFCYAVFAQWAAQKYKRYGVPVVVRMS